MKKSILLGIAGLALAGVTSYGQGFILIDNYSASGSLQNAGVTYGAGVFANGVSGALGTVGAGLNGSWTVGLYFVTGTPSINDPAGNGIPASPLALGSGTGATTQVGSAAVLGTPGAFTAADSFAAAASAGTVVTVELIAYDTAGGSYANAAFRGHSNPFTVTTVAGNAQAPAYTPAPSWSVTPVAVVPEPTTLALAGLGGFGMLMALRRKQA